MTPGPSTHKFTGAGVPDLDGTIGAAWLRDSRGKVDVPPEDNRMLAEWLLWCPLVSPARQHWVLALVSLAPSPALTIPVYALGTTHELGIVGLDDTAALPFDGTMTLPGRPELSFQFAASGDQAARGFARLVAKGVCDGTVFPEPGVIGGSGPYHGETLALLLEDADRGWHLTRGMRPSPVLRQAEHPRKLWHITRPALGGRRLSNN